MYQDTYLSVAEPSEGLYKEKGSKFLSFAYPVENEQMAKDIIETLKKKHYDARHHCFAWVLGQDKTTRAYDDGEPNHSAGDSILRQIRSHNLTNVLIVVVRYFGGTKLGVSGLVNAYKTAAADAIANNKIVEKILSQVVTFSYNYADMNQIMSIIKECSAEIINQQFDNTCHVTLRIRQKTLETLIAKLSDIESAEQVV